MILYISEPISSNMNGYKSRFGKVESVLKLRGHIVLNPAVHPLGLPYEAYLKIDLAMVDVSDGIVMLHGWQNSNGVRRELKHALRMGKKVFYGIESVPNREELKSGQECLRYKKTGGKDHEHF